MAQRIQLRRGTAAEWTAANPVLALGEPGVETDTGKQKFGNGTTAWAGLPYASAGPQGPAGVADDESVEALVASPTSATRTALNATILDSIIDAKTEVDVRDYGAVLDGVADDTAAIQAALNTGQNVVISGKPNTRAIARTTGTLTMKSTSRGQCLTTRNAVIHPAFVGDVVRVNQVFQRVTVGIEGNLQPSGDYSNVAMIGIGRGGTNPKCASVAYSTVQSVKGSAIIWEQGAHVDFTQFYADTMTHDGIRCDGVLYDDNNHGLFNNCHITKAAGIGYHVQSSTSEVTDNKSRSHQFINTKAFQCGQNYRIESINNVGTVFSELGLTPDEFTATSMGNNIEVIDGKNEYENWIDNGQGNRLSGYSTYSNWDTKKMLVRALRVNNIFAGVRELTQTANYTFVDRITDTNLDATVTHTHGGTGKRTDTFTGPLNANGGFTAGAGASITGNFRLNSSTRTASMTLSGTSASVNVADASAGPITLTLPNVANGTEFTFVKTDSSANAVTIWGTINGVQGYTLSTQYKHVKVVSSGSNTWFVIGAN